MIRTTENNKRVHASLVCLFTNPSMNVDPLCVITELESSKIYDKLAQGRADVNKHDLVPDLPKAQEALWEMIDRGALQLLTLDAGDVPRIRELMKKYANRPMDLADAALLRVAEREGIGKIFTVDRRDFSVYRLHGRIRPALLP